MRVPSNRMPALAEPGPDSPWVPAVFTSVVGLTALLISPIVAFLAEIMVVWMWVEVRCSLRRRQRLMEQRPHDSICTFARSFDCRVVDTWVIRATYEGLQYSLDAPDLPIRATDRLDDLYDLYDIDPDMFAFDADEIAERCGRTLDGAVDHELFGHVETVRQFVTLLNDMPRADANA